VPCERELVEQVGLHELDVASQMLDPREVLGDGPRTMPNTS